MIEALDIFVKGVVQGVGFRPFVYKLAKKYLINGWVMNTKDGVHIRAEGESDLLDEFVLQISNDAPAAAQVKEIEMKEVPLEPFDSFEIRFSDDVADAKKNTLVSPDLATCADCERELFDESDRRYHYPFINCTNCGPRFTIIDDLPYDRGNTSMSTFDMCPDCASEYSNPEDRRFHAQPDACATCGPTLWLIMSKRDAPNCSYPSSSACAPLHRGAPAVILSEARSAKSKDLPECSRLERNDANNNDKTWTTDAQSTIAPDDMEAYASATHRVDGPLHRGAPAVISTEVSASERSGEISRMGHVQQAGDALQEQHPGDFSTSVLRTSARNDSNFHNTHRVDSSDDIIDTAARLLVEGKILAVKGLGGYHLVCDANNESAIATLRQRKGRDGKPLATMMRTVDDVRQICNVSKDEEAMLTGSVRPIVLLQKRTNVRVTSGLADNLPELGVMLPYTPVQHLLLDRFAALSADIALDNTPMLVMTSGNLHNEPIVIDDDEAILKLGNIADAILGNNRPIRARFDDSVVRLISTGEGSSAIQFIRRARGYAPIPLLLKNYRDTTNVPTIFATGSQQKNTFAYLRGNEAFVSQHIGDMEDAGVFEAWLETKSRYEHLFDLSVGALSCDLHPEYITSKWAREQAQKSTPDLPLVEVQHHHAHIVSVIAENALEPPVCGIAFDGTGYGVDGNIWGGEVLISNESDFERFANFAYVPMPGGSAAIKHPLQMAYGVLWEFDLLEHPGAKSAIDALGADKCANLDAMIEQGINTPVTSSVGRLFDAASALLGICSEPSYEGEAAVLLEAALWDDMSTGSDCTTDGTATEPYEIAITKNVATENSTAQDTSVFLFDAAPAFSALLDDFAAGVSVGLISRKFHSAFVAAIVSAAQLTDALYGIRTVALTGGVFMNRYIIESSLQALEQAGFTAAINCDLPPNDGCISFGQAVVSYAKLNNFDKDTNS